MSLINLLNEQKKEQEVSDLKNTGRTLISAAAVAGTAYMLSENINLKAGVKKSYGVLKNSSAAQNELGKAGNIIRQDAEQLKKIVEASKKESLEKLKTNILSDSNLEELFSKSGSVEDARAFLSAVFDVASTDMIDDTGTLTGAIERLYKGAGTDSLEDSDKKMVTDFFKNSIRSNQERLEEFKRRRSLQLRTRGQFNTTISEFTTEGTNTVQWKTASASDLVASGAKRKYDELKSMASGKNVQLVSLEEYGVGQGKSVYARIEHGNGKFQNVALQLQRDKNTGTAIIRGTGNLSTRYTVAGGVIDATRLFPSLDLNQLSTPTGNVQEAFNKATMSFEDHMFGMLKENQRAFQNFDTRHINQYNDYIRSMSIDTPRNMIPDLNRSRVNTVTGKREYLIDEDLMSTISDSRRIQTATEKIVGLEKFAPKDREKIVSRLLKYNPETYGGTTGAQTLTSRFVDPFDLNRELVVGQIDRLVDQSGDETFTALNIIKKYGYLDRGLVKQTSRPGQMYGRPELASGFAGLDANATFGRAPRVAPPKGSRKRISKPKVIARSGGLIGVESGELTKNVRGVNFGAIMVFEKLDKAIHPGGKEIVAPASKLGLGEGMSYMGGVIQAKKGYTKTVNREGIAQSKLLTETLEALKDGRGFLTIGSKTDGDDYDIDEFFKMFGNDQGEAVLGKQDDKVVTIKRHQGMRRFTLGLSEKSTETARDRYHFVGDIFQDVRHSKLFSVLAKDTTLTISQPGMMAKLNELGLEDIGEFYFNKDGFGGLLENTLLTSTSQVSKTATYLRTQIHGGMRMLGLNEDAMNKALDDNMKSLNDADQLLAEVNEKLMGGRGVGITSVDQVTAEQRSATTLGKFFQTISQRAGEENITAKEFSMVFSFARDRAASGKFGLNLEYFEQKVREGLIASGKSESEADEFLNKTDEMAKRGVVIGAASGTIGTPHTDLGRNVAKAEPRFANFLYSSLRSFWGMSAEESSSYVSSMITRMDGFESRASGLLGMKVTQESLGKLDAGSIKKQIEGIADVGKLTTEEVEELLSMGQGRERDVIQKLSEKKGGNLISIDEIGLSKRALDAFYDLTDGKKEIFLPGEDTFKGFIGHEIRSTNETIKVEAEYGRNVNDLLSSLSSLKDAGDDPDEISKAMKGFTAVRGRLAKVTGAAVRSSLSGKIAGSGSFMGGGFSVGKMRGGERIGATIFSENKTVQKKIVEGLSEVINKEMGYVAFMDQQAFLDGMSTYESALTKGAASQGSVSTRAETRRIMQDTLEAFFTGMHQGKKEGTSATIQRNPLLGFSHVWAGMGIYQYDFEAELEPLKYLRNITGGEEYTDAYKEKLKEVRRALNQPKITAELAGEAGLSTEAERNAIFKRSEEIYNERQKIKAEREAIKAEDGYEDFVARRGELISQRKKVSESLDNNPFLELRQSLFELGESHESHLDLIDEDITAAQKLRESKLESLPKLIATEEAKLKTEEDELKKILKDTPDATDEKNEKERVIQSKKQGIERMQKQIPQIEEQIRLAKENEPRFKRPVLGGGDISDGTVRRALDAEHGKVFRETLEDFGAQVARQDNLERIAGESAADTAYENTGREFRHFKNSNEAADFINNLGKYYGFETNRSLSTGMFNNEYLQNLYESGSRDKPISKSGKTHQLTRLERLNPSISRDYVSSKIKEIRSGGAGIVNVNLATKEELMQIKGIGEKTANEILRIREVSSGGGIIINEEDFRARATGLNKSQKTRAINAFRRETSTYVPMATKLGAYEILTGGRETTEVYARDYAFYAGREANRRLNGELESLEASPMRGKQKKRQSLYAETEKLNLEEEQLKVQKDKIKAAQVAVQGDADSLTLGDIDKMIMEGSNELNGIDTSFSGDKLQARTAPRTNRDLLELDSVLGREVKTSSDLAELRSLNEAGSLTPEQSGAYRRLYSHMHRSHLQYGVQGGGIIRMPQIDMSMKLKDTTTGKTMDYTGRMDFVRFGIGDYDADPYQVFFDTDKTLRKRVMSGEVDAKKLYTYGAEFLGQMSLLGEGMEQLGKRMGASQMTVAQSIVDEFQKEQIVKGIGGLDVQVKAGMLGLAQAAADDVSGDFGAQFRRMQAGAALVSVAQEVLGIKGKKLPIAADISREYVTALRTSYESGSGDALKNFFQQKVFKGTLLENATGEIRVDAGSVHFHNLGEGAATNRFREALGDVKINVQDIFDSFDIMAKQVKKHGLNRFTSNSALGKVMEGSSRFDMKQLFGLLNQGASMEGGAIIGEMEQIEDIFSRIDKAGETLAESVSRSKGLAGIVAGSLLASYAIGSGTEIGSLEPGAKFSDSRSREALRAGQSLSNRAVQQSFSKEHSNVGPARISGTDNFYERPINNGVTTVSLNRSIQMYGEAPNLSAAQTMGKHFVSAGGQASLTINDTRQPIGAAYINKMIRD